MFIAEQEQTIKMCLWLIQIDVNIFYIGIFVKTHINNDTSKEGGSSGTLACVTTLETSTMQ